MAYLAFCLPSQPIKLCIDNKEVITLTENPELYYKNEVYQSKLVLDLRNSWGKKDCYLIYFYSKNADQQTYKAT